MVTLHLLLGKPGKAKQKMQKKLERANNALFISPDEWCRQIFDSPGSTDRVKNRQVIETITWSHVSRVLKLGLDVILDYADLTETELEELRNKAKKAGAGVEVYRV